MLTDALSAALDDVVDGATFLHFVELLAAERKAFESHPVSLDGHAGPWANHTIADFLKAAAAWAADSDFGARAGIDSANPWKRCAYFLWAGRGYE